MLGANKKPLPVPGVPPDYLDRTGQLRGHRVYRWEAIKSDGDRWWVERFEKDTLSVRWST
jgi:4-alpha-glucanotransferase